MEDRRQDPDDDSELLFAVSICHGQLMIFTTSELHGRALTAGADRILLAARQIVVEELMSDNGGATN
jgi:hypothetical protein